MWRAKRCECCTSFTWRIHVSASVNFMAVSVNFTTASVNYGHVQVRYSCLTLNKLSLITVHVQKASNAMCRSYRTLPTMPTLPFLFIPLFGFTFKIRNINIIWSYWLNWVFYKGTIPCRCSWLPGYTDLCFSQSSIITKLIMGVFLWDFENTFYWYSIGHFIYIIKYYKGDVIHYHPTM